MGSDKGEPKTPTNGSGADPRVRAMLQAVAEAINRLVAALDDVGVNRRLRESPTCQLRALDRGLPDETLADFLLRCEAFATVTGPATLTSGNLTEIRSEAQRIQRRVQALMGAVRGARRLTLTGSSSQTRGAFLRAALVDTQVQDALATLLASLTALTDLEEEGAQKRKRLLVVGPGCVVPTAVLGGALALIVFLLASIALVTTQTPTLTGALNIPSLSLHPVATATATSAAIMRRPTATPKTGRASTPPPAVKPTLTATASSTTGYGSLSVSPSSIPACQGQNVAFTLTHTGGSLPVSWQASGFDTNSIQLNPSSGSLSPGQSVQVDVTVTADSVGSITITPSHNLPAQTVSYDSSGC